MKKANHKTNNNISNNNKDKIFEPSGGSSGLDLFEEKEGHGLIPEKNTQFNQSKTNFYGNTNKLEKEYQPSEERYSNEFIRNEIEKANRGDKYFDSGNLFSDKFYDFDEVSPKNSKTMNEKQGKM